MFCTEYQLLYKFYSPLPQYAKMLLSKEWLRTCHYTKYQYQQIFLRPFVDNNYRIRTPQLLTILILKIEKVTVSITTCGCVKCRMSSNSKDPDQTPQNAASDQGQYCLPRSVCLSVRILRVYTVSWNYARLFLSFLRTERRLEFSSHLQWQNKKEKAWQGNQESCILGLILSLFSLLKHLSD